LYTKLDIAKSLKNLKIKKNDSLYVSSSFGMLGLPKFKIKNLDILSKIFIEILQETIGEKGTIFAPTFSYSFSSQQNVNKNIFDVEKSKSKVGPFGEYLRKLNHSNRSPDPMVSIAGIGNDSIILKKIGESSYGKNCTFEKLKYVKNLMILNIGVGPNYIPFLHHLDYLSNCKHRYNKYFNGMIIKNNKSTSVRWHYPVPYKKKWAESDGHKLAKLAEDKLILNSKLGIGNIYVSNYNKMFNFCLKISKKNPWITATGKK
tara:strand:- start:402 stop:1181 length:780 start_codon:yes stop_codon:yes gene_type:complete